MISFAAGILDVSGAFPADVKTISIVMPASILPKAKFDRGKTALEKAGDRVKVREAD